MEKELDRLCEVLDAELERQELVLAVVRAQRNAMLTRDVEYLEAKTEALNELMRESHEAQNERLDALGRVVTRLELPKDQQTMTGLIRVAPEPWQSRLSEFQKGLQAAVSASSEHIRGNAGLLRRSMRLVNKCLDSLHECERGAEYGPKGNGPERPREAALIDQKG